MKIKKLPLSADIETKKILKKSISANRALANLNGVANTIPNQNIIINSLVLQEAKDSSEIENIITTHDELYKSSIDSSNISQATKEVNSYAKALKEGFKLVKKHNLLLVKDIIVIQAILENNDAGIRKQAGTVLKNEDTGEVVFTPPQSENEIRELLSNLEKYINTGDDIDPLIKMAIIHHQFESIHPFYDGNGRTGRIINILYLVLNGLLDIPILYLSRYIIQHKADYYRLLQEARTKRAWEEWILFMLDGVEQTSKETIKMINAINNLMQVTARNIQEKLPKIYSKDLVDILFIHPYTKIEFLTDKKIVKTRQTASLYLKELENIGLMKSIKLGRNIFYINIELFNMLKNGVKLDTY
ncbi:Fic family protein [Sulfurimonas sp.]